VNRVGIKTDRLAISIVMSGKSGLHIVERGGVIDGRGTVARIAKSRGLRNQSIPLQPLKSLQPGVHQMRATTAPVIEEGIHRNLPESGKFGLTLANPGSRQTVVSEAIVQSIRPEGVSVFFGNGDGGRCRRIVGELRLVQKSQGIGGEVEVGSTEALDGREWDAGESIESDKVSVNFFNWRGTDVGHSKEYHEAMSKGGRGSGGMASSSASAAPNVIPQLLHL